MGRPSWIGTTLKGRYKIDSLLGQGGMSAVYKANDPNLRRVVAVKLIHTHLADNPQFLTRFEEEAAAVAQLRHPNIVQVYDFDHDEDVYYMVLEFVPGETLNDRLKRLNKDGRQLDLVESLTIMHQVCEAVEYAHRRDLVHRDIKPANIMLNVQGQAILMDFGIVKMVGGDSHTATGAVLGTALYMSPEQVQGESAEPRSDIYSLGVNLFEMLSGKPPFQADSVMTILMMHLTDPIPDLNGLRKGIPRDVVAIIEKAMAKKPQDRYQSAEEMAADIQSALARIRSGKPLPVDETAQAKPDFNTVIDDGTMVEAPKAVPQVASPPPDEATFVDQPTPVKPPPNVIGGTEQPSTLVDSGPPPERPKEFYSSPKPATAPPRQQPAMDESQLGLQKPGQVDRAPVQQSAARTGVPADPSATGQIGKKNLPWALIAAGGAGVLLVGAIIVTIILIAINNGGDGDNLASLSAQATRTAEVAIIAAEDTESATQMPDELQLTATSEPTATATIPPTATTPPTATKTSPPTDTPTPTVPPGIPYVRINKISIDDQNRYVVEYETFEYTEQLPGVHVHFFFDTVPPEQAGVPGNGPWILYGGPRPFTGYKVADKPGAARKMCALVANANHSVQANSGTCFVLP